MPRRRGRPKKSETSTPELPEETGTAAPTRRRGRSSKKTEEEADDPSYQPTGTEQLEEGDEDAEQDSGVGALAWGLITAGGLGYGSSAVYGAEVMAR